MLGKRGVENFPFMHAAAKSISGGSEGTVVQEIDIVSPTETVVGETWS